MSPRTFWKGPISFRVKDQEHGRPLYVSKKSRPSVSVCSVLINLLPFGRFSKKVRRPTITEDFNSVNSKVITFCLLD